MRIIVRLSTLVKKSYDYFTVTYKKNIELNLLYRKIKRPVKTGRWNGLVPGSVTSYATVLCIVEFL